MYWIPPNGRYPFLVVWDTVAEDLIISHRVAPAAAIRSASGVFENVPAGEFHLFVRNIGCILDYEEQPVAAGVMVCKLLGTT